MNTDIEDFFRILYRALKMITTYFEKKYGWGKDEICPRCSTVMNR